MIPLKSTDERSIQVIASNHARGYRSLVAANSATGFGDPKVCRRTSAQITTASAFFVPVVPCYGGCAWETERSAGFLYLRFANPRTAASLRLATLVAAPTDTGASPMKHALIPSAALKARAAAHRAMALAALRSNSSLAVRLSRYNRHQMIARSLQALEATTVRGGAA